MKKCNKQVRYYGKPKPKKLVIKKWTHCINGVAISGFIDKEQT